MKIFELVEGTCQMLERQRHSHDKDNVRAQLVPQPTWHWLLGFPNLAISFHRSKLDVLLYVIISLASEKTPIH